MSEIEPAEAAGSRNFALPTSALPWHQIPKFEPGVTDLRTYTRKLEFLRDLWPAEHLEHLAPRAALQVEGSAFQKVARLKAEKLRTADGVRYLVESLGGQWGRLDDEDRYDLFERALYSTQQKHDETNDSYLTRHEVIFDDLIGRGVKLEEIQAYVLLRQSSLSSEDRKKVILDGGGKLQYESAKKSIRLLGSKFFNDLQSGGRSNQRQKTYDVNHVDEVEEAHHTWAPVEPEWDEDAFQQQMLDEQDEDAHFIQDFEEQIVLTCQDSQELAACFNTYQEARDRLRDKAKSRGFWPIRGGNYGKGKGRGGKKGRMSSGSFSSSSSFTQKRKSLAERIANSTCRKCGQPGHWRRECPLNNERDKDKTNFTGLAMTSQQADDFDLENTEVIDHLPADAVLIHEGQEVGKGERSSNFYFPGKDTSFEGCESPDICDGAACCCFHVDVSRGMHDFGIRLSSKLNTCCRNHFGARADAAAATSTQSNFSRVVDTGTGTKCDSSFSTVDCLFNSEEDMGEAIIDTGASRAVIGDQRLKGMLDSLPDSVRHRSYRARTPGIVFKFGNASKLTSSFAILLPRSQKGWIRVEVVPGQTPFLISNSILKGLRGIVDVEDQVLRFKDNPTVIPLKPCRKSLLSVKVADLLMSAPTPMLNHHAEVIMHTEQNHEHEHDMKVGHDHEGSSESSENRIYPNHQFQVNEHVQQCSHDGIMEKEGNSQS